MYFSLNSNFECKWAPQCNLDFYLKWIRPRGFTNWHKSIFIGATFESIPLFEEVSWPSVHRHTVFLSSFNWLNQPCWSYMIRNWNSGTFISKNSLIILVCDTSPNPSKFSCYDNTGCGVFKERIQNLKDFGLKINFSQMKLLNFENWSR